MTAPILGQLEKDYAGQANAILAQEKIEEKLAELGAG